MQQYFLQTPLESLYSCPGIKNHTIILSSVVILPLNPSLQYFFFPSLICLFLSLFSESPIVFSFHYHTKKKSPSISTLLLPNIIPCWILCRDNWIIKSCVEWRPCLSGSIPPIRAPGSQAAQQSQQRDHFFHQTFHTPTNHKWNQTLALCILALFLWEGTQTLL